MKRKLFLLLLLSTLVPRLLQAQTAKAIWCEGNTTLYFTYDTNTYSEGDTYDGQTISTVYAIPVRGFGNNTYSSTDYQSVPWYSTIRQSVTNVEIAPNFIDFTPTSLSNFWYGFSNLTIVTGSEYINTSNTRYMQRMFSSCVNLKSLNVSNWDVSNVTDMRTAFRACRSLTALDVGNWDVSKVTDMSEVFWSCNSLTSLDVSNWNVGNVTYMSNAFNECSSLTSLDVSRWNVSKLLRADNLFARCSGLTSLDISNWDVSSVQWMNGMFSGCSALTSLDVSRWDVSSTTQMNHVFSGCKQIQSLDVENWDVSNVDRMAFMFDGCSQLSGLDVSKWNVGKVREMTGMFRSCRDLASLDVGNWNVSSVYGAGYMFQFCDNLSSLDVSRWDVSNVLYMNGMFWGCDELTSLDVSKWDVGNVTTMEALFASCRKLTSLDVSKWNTGKVNNMNAIFSNCVNLTALNVSNWDVSKVTDMRQMFISCTRLAALDVSGWNTRSATMTSSMFYDCRKLTHLTFGKDFNMENVPDNNMRGLMFSRTFLLRYLDFFASDDTDAIKAVDRSSGMFSGLPETTIVYLPHGSKNVTDKRNVVYSNDIEGIDLRCAEYYSADRGLISNSEQGYIDIEFPHDFITNKAIYQRTMSNNYGSVILPYTFTTNANIQAYTLDDEFTNEMYFVDTETVPAHTPFAFKKLSDNNVADFTMSAPNFGIKVNATRSTNATEDTWTGAEGAPYIDTNNINTSATSNVSHWSSKGYYVSETVEDYSDAFYIAGDRFYRATGALMLYPHRVTFHGRWTKGKNSVSDYLGIATDHVNNTTAIDGIQTHGNTQQEFSVYDICGRRQTNMTNGINIIRNADGSVRKVIK